jgi:hypothetical protein
MRLYDPLDLFVSLWFGGSTTVCWADDTVAPVLIAAFLIMLVA